MPHNNYHSSFAAILLATLMLASTACSATDRTPITAAPGDTTGDTTATPRRQAAHPPPPILFLRLQNRILRLDLHLRNQILLFINIQT